MPCAADGAVVVPGETRLERNDNGYCIGPKRRYLFSANQNVPNLAHENLTIGRSAIVRTMLRDGVASNKGSVSPC